MTVALCVLLWAHPGEEEGLVAYEDAVLALIPEHRGRVVQRARTDGADGRPLEVQFYEFESQDALDSYISDERRLLLAPERDRVIARTDIMPVSLR